MTYVIGTAFQADVLPSSFSPAHPRYARMYRVKTASLSTAFQADHGCKIPTEFLLSPYYHFSFEIYDDALIWSVVFLPPSVGNI